MNMVPLLEIHCSALDRVGRCPASLVPPTIQVTEDTTAADSGSAQHALMARQIKGQSLNIDEEDQFLNIDEVADEYGVDADELARDFWDLWRQYEPLAFFFPQGTPEVSFAPLFAHGAKLVGRADLVSRTEDEIRVLDYKTGRLELPCQEQIKGYCLLALQSFPAPRAYGIVLRPRLQTYEAWRWSAEELRDWWSEFCDRLNKSRWSFGPGEHCTYCPRRIECPARRQYLAQIVASLENLTVGDFAVDPIMKGKIIGTVYQKIKILRPLLDKWWDWIKEEVKMNGGQWPLDDGWEIAIKEEPRQQIDFARAEQILRQELGEEFSKVVTASKTKALEIIRARAPARQKGLAAKEFLGKLEKADAVTISFVEKLELRQRKR